MTTFGTLFSGGEPFDYAQDVLAGVGRLMQKIYRQLVG